MPIPDQPDSEKNPPRSPNGTGKRNPLLKHQGSKPLRMVIFLPQEKKEKEKEEQYYDKKTTTTKVMVW